jgi:hypothetical protein
MKCDRLIDRVVWTVPFVGVLVCLAVPLLPIATVLEGEQGVIGANAS